jgi:hypothetical protein
MRKLLVLLLAVLAAAGYAASSVGANPPGVPSGWKMEYKWNMIGYPAGQEYTGGCGNGARIFVNRDASNAHVIVTDQDDGWYVADCNATADHTAVIHSDDVGTFHVFAEILGKPGGTLSICADVLVDESTQTLMCELGTFNLGPRVGGKANFHLAPDEIFDASLEDILWFVTTNNDFRIAQFRVYRES